MRMLFYTTACAALYLSACSTDKCVDTDTPSISLSDKSDEHMATVKPGANVIFSAQLREPLFPGDTGALEITMREGHQSGQMRVTASASEGLEMFTTIDEARFNLADEDMHEWTVYFDTDKAGRFNINLHATVETPIGTMTRSHAVPILVGDAETKPDSSVTQSPEEGERRRVIMNAKETIDSN